MRFTQRFFTQILAGFAVLMALTVVVGVAYPAGVWAVSRLDRDSAEGSALVDTNGCVVGSALVGVDSQPVGDDPFFHTRVIGSPDDDDAFAPGDPAAAAPSNLGPNSEVLADFVDRRRARIAEREGVDPASVPVDAVTGSGSGVDPDISPAYARLQIPRVAAVTGRAVADVTALVDENTSGRQWGFLGAERVNVPRLNLALGLTAPGCAAQ